MSRKQEWQKGWKVIRKSDRMSCTASYRENPVKYPKYTKVERPKMCGPLAVFETRKAARKFKKDATGQRTIGGSWKIVRCIYVKSSDKILWEHDTDSYLPQFEFGFSPSRTDFADSVTCLE